ncbi:bifunctional phosphopantothenoylcysteine decarboxylase/phosphopantothenate--cysteine ligase CoaBC [Flexithrix dorotheae]|uniref:bifunctional phosphopantothenoylcysteine decarboxylase/phosphopantothenate--cysteine ligase CoaBC n=1 Tax=Flexithrix dorotheae TaxID=70993 RepID=UPI000367035E|nr:bifunctional phosphopantothenoylcysteine decarboxylase/phosphopantothenate--cysteine ligase CoaBC [Flexithrix dorotheae]
MLKNKKILLGITGSIAAYKAALLVRLLKKQGAEVKVVMTTSASSFITPLTLATLSENPVLIDFVKDDSGQWNNHVDLGIWADLMIIAPASANTIAKMANGICDNLLMAVYLSARCPVFLAPAMDLDMYAHPATQQNIEKLINFGHHIIDAESGELASGLVGKGRMAEPENILQKIDQFFQKDLPLQGKQIMITAGPTYEYIDPVRYISNGSTGKMGFALAGVLNDLGAEVTIISGPTHQELPHNNIRLVKVETAQEMYEQALLYFTSSDVAIFSAAVADYTPAEKSKVKIKKSTATLNIKLSKTKDIAKELGKIKKSNQLSVGFALETNDEIENAKSKLKSKNFDLVILNSLNDKGAGFGYDTNQITMIDQNGEMKKFELKQKSEVARDICEEIISKLKALNIRVL